MKNIIYLIVIIFIGFSARAQEIEFACGTSATQEQIKYLTKTRAQRQTFNQNIQARMSLTQVPIQCHIVRTSQGTGGLTASDITDIIDTMNFFFANANIEFYQADTINYIDNSSYYEFDSSDEQNLCFSNDKPFTINIYFVNKLLLQGTPVGGYSHLPPSYDRVFITNSCALYGNIMSHEMGHYFSLYHTHGKSNNFTTDELVDGSNCSFAGDDICDTPADPNLIGSSALTINGCIYYGTDTDANGDVYVPDLSNIMSYSLCKKNFTQGQYNRITYSLINDRSYLLNDSTSGQQIISIPDPNFEQALINHGIDWGQPDGSITNKYIHNTYYLSLINYNISDLTGIEYFTNLIWLHCGGNQLTSLDVSNNTALTDLMCQVNQLTGLDVSQNTALTKLTCHDNQLECLNVKNGNNVNFYQNGVSFAASGNPNLSCIEVDDAVWATANWTFIDTGTLFSNNCNYNCTNNSTSIFEDRPQTEKLTIYPNPMNSSATIELPEGPDSYSLFIYDVLGNVVRTVENISSKNLILEKGDLTNGVYLYQLSSINSSYSGRLIVQ